MRHRETKKLFYDEYLYKLSVLNSLGHIFREKNFKHARDELDQLQLQYERNEPLTRGSFRKKTYNLETFQECKLLYKELSKRDDYKLRIENPSLHLYSNNKDWLISISKLVKTPISFYEPKRILEKNTILVDKPTAYEYRITLNSNPDPNLAQWIIKNPNLAKAGPVFLEEVANNGYSKGLYFYVRDEKILNLVALMLGKTTRVDKIVYTQDLDK